MKRLIAPILALLPASLPGLAAAQPVAGPYVSLGGGGSLQQNEIALPAPLLGRLHDNDWKFDPGIVGEISAGYGLGHGIRFEAEGDYLSNHVREYEASQPRRAGGYETKYGGMANILFDFDLRLPIHPYLGLGAGGQVVTQHDFNQSGPNVRLPGDGASESVGAFAYQGIAGASMPLSWIAGLSATAEYRFLGLLDPMPAFLRDSANTHAVSNVHFTNNFNHSVLLGVRYALFQPAPPPAQAPDAVPVAPAPAAARTYLVFFDWDRSDLTRRARQIVAEAAQASTRVQTTRIEVSGYTDLSGTAAYNTGLSVRRAQSVEAELVRDGVTRGEIVIHGFGQSDPLVPTAKGVREPQNRRVEIVLR